MRRVTALALLILLALGVMPASAQSQDDRDGGTRKLTKILIGAGALAVGTAVAAKSSQTTTVNSALGASETSTFSTSQLVTGLAVAGVGGIILWDGLRRHDSSRPATQMGVGLGARGSSVFVRRVW